MEKRNNKLADLFGICYTQFSTYFSVEVNRCEKSLRSTQPEKQSKSLPPDKGKSTEKDIKPSDKSSTSSIIDSKVVTDSKSNMTESPGQLFSPLPEGQVIATVPATTQV